MTEIHIEGIQAESYEHGMEHLFSYAAIKSEQAYDYCLLMLEDDPVGQSPRYTIVERNRMPCWGALREYNCGTRPNDDWPSDLQEPRHIFPKTGKVAALACRMAGMRWAKDYSTKDQRNEFVGNFAFNPSISPWRSVLKDFELVIKNDEFNGVVFKDCHIDPTVLVSMLRMTFSASSASPALYSSIIQNNPDIHPMVAFLKMERNSYGMSQKVVLERFFKAQPFDMSNGGTLYDRESYNRPDLDYIFGGKGNVGVKTTEKSIEYLTEQMRLILADQQSIAA